MAEDLASLCAALASGCRKLRVDSRLVEAGDIFVALPGNTVDGAQFIADAAGRGAYAIVCSHDRADQARAAARGCVVAPVAQPIAALGQLASAAYHTPGHDMRLIGITGTNGKTTCAWLLDYLFSALSHRCGVLGTIDYRWPGHRQSASLTTPGCLDLHAMLADMHSACADMAIMEVSSHALALGRVAGLSFSGAIFTNLTQDHLDFHPDMEAYFKAKAELFLNLPLAAKAAAINGDDPYGRRLLALLPDAISYGLAQADSGRRHLAGAILALAPEGMRLRMSYGGADWELATQLVGAFNAYNLLAVQALALGMGASPDDLAALSGFTGVPGRLERVAASSGRHVFVDYAHTPDALVNALKALRGAGFGRIITVFGCGGNRDRSKRPLMGRAVAENSDLAILTSDNPRKEDPLAIMRDVEPGLSGCARYYAEPDRKAATALALNLLEPGDALLIAGKGHEDYQIIGEERRHYSDQETVREILHCD